MLSPIHSTSAIDSLSVSRNTESEGATFAQELSKSSTSTDDSDLREAFNQFVGQTLYGSLLKELRKSEQGAAYLNGGHAEKVFRGQLDQVLVEKMSDSSADSLTGPMFDLMMANRRP